MKDTRKSLRRLSVAVLIAALLLPGALFAADEIKIGVLFPLTGGAASAGRELRAGAELAADIANNVMPDLNMTMAKNAGIKSLGGAKITLIFKDHEGNPTLGADLAKKLILDDKVHGLMGAYHSCGHQGRQRCRRTVRGASDQRLLDLAGPDPPGLQVVLARDPS